MIDVNRFGALNTNSLELRRLIIDLVTMHKIFVFFFILCESF